MDLTDSFDNSNIRLIGDRQKRDFKLWYCDCPRNEEDDIKPMGQLIFLAQK